MRSISARRRALAIAAAAVACWALIPASASATVTLSNWDAAQQRQVVRAGLIANVGRSFRGSAAVSAAQANASLGALAQRLGLRGTARAHRSPVTVFGFDGLVITQLGLGDVASHVQKVAVAAGLRPPPYFGSEVVARFLGLRYNHPTGTDQLELFATDPITRAEAAWSLSRVLGFGDWEVSYARQTLDEFALPTLTDDQLKAVTIAVSRIGYPYVWGGTTDDTSDGLAHGGFDCSGFVWRVFKGSGLSWGKSIRGRTAAQQAGEIAKSRRLRISALAPGDLLFFGTAGFGSTATESNITHEGIYLGDNWVINASSQGVYVEPLTGSWLGDSFAWGRRVIG